MFKTRVSPVACSNKNPLEELPSHAAPSACLDLPGGARSVRFAKPADINLGTIRNRSLRGSEKSHKQNGLSRKRFHNRSRTSARKSLRPGTLAYSNLPFHVFHESVEGEATARNIQISIIPSCCSLMSQLEDPANHKFGSVFRKLM